MQRGSSNLTQKCSTISSGEPFILGSKGQGHEVQKQYQCGVWHSRECWLFVVSHQIVYLKSEPMRPADHITILNFSSSEIHIKSANEKC